MSKQSVVAGRADMRPLRRSSAGTLHYQLYATLSEMIRSGSIHPGDRMPTEAELVETYEVSRTTARRALDELRRQGVVERQPGKGTFVLPPRLNATIPHLHSIDDEIEHLGYRPGIVPLAVRKGSATEPVAQNLGLEPGDPVLLVKRVRTADDQPVYVSDSALNVLAFPEVADADFASAGMYYILQAVTGRQLVKAVQWLSAVPASREVAKILHIKSGAPVLQLERILYMENDIPVDFVTGYFHGELYKHYSESHPQLPSPS